MQRRKKYLYSNAVIPARTLRYQRLKAAQRAVENMAYEPQVAASAAAAQPTQSDEGVTFSQTSCRDEGDLRPNLFDGEVHPSTSAGPIASGLSNEESLSSDLYLTKMDSGLTSSPSSSIASNSDESSESSTEDSDSDFENEELLLGQNHNPDSTAVDGTSFTQSTFEDGNEQFQSFADSTEHDEYLQTPLCDFTETTKGDALVMCLALGLQHKLSWACIEDILKYVNCLFGQDVVKATKYFFRKYMAAADYKVRYHLYCPYCIRYLGNREEVHATNMVCQCGQTIKDVTAASTFFLSLNLEAQIRELLEDEFFIESLQYRFTRKKKHEESIEDIYDGEVYKSMSAEGQLLSQWYNMSYTMNTDGFPVGGKSGKQTCWPIYVQINELPPRLRSRYMLLAGIFVGKKDPNMNIFMYPFVEEANFLSTEGINWYFKGRKVNSKIIPLSICVDTPARSKVLNCTAFSGAYGCTLCYTNPESTASGVRYTISASASRTERTHKEILVDAIQAHNNFTLVRNKKKRRVRGVIGPSPIHNLYYLDLVKGVRPDYMHSMLLGNAKHIFTVLHDSVGKDYYIGSDVRLATIYKRLLSIKPPTSVFRSFLNFMNFTSLKAKDWRSWLLFYAVPCLLDIIPTENVMHLSLVSTALHIALGRSILPSDLSQANTLALRYVFSFEQFYGKEEMVYNLHLLTHLKNNLAFLGPAWTHAAFGFEAANKELLELKKGASSIAKEMANKYLTFKALPHLCEKFCSTEKSHTFCKNLSGKPDLKSFVRLGEAVLGGKGKWESLNTEQTACLSNSRILPQNQVRAFEKLLMDGILYRPSSYSRSSKTDDSFISVQEETKARIEKILLLEDECGSSIILLVREILEDETPIFPNDEYSKHCHIKKIGGEGQLFAIKPQDISGQCVAMFVESGNFICDVPYGCYGDT